VSIIPKVKLPAADNKAIHTILSEKYYEVTEGMEKRIVDT
jgi:hypothetical protein